MLPPYYDQATGLFVEANYLVETGFDYARLSREARWSQGGPAVYLISIWPTLLALLMWYAPSIDYVLIVFHLFNFACAALVAMLVYALTVPHTSRIGAALTAVALLSVPAFNVQIDLLGMDLPVVVAALACAWLLARRQFSLAVLCGALAFSIKASGRAVSLGVMIYLILALTTMAPWQSRQFKLRLVIAMLLGLAVLGVQFSANAWLNSRPGSAAEDWSQIVATNNAATLNDETIASVGRRHLANTWDWFPDQVTIFAMASCGFVLLLIAALARQVCRHGGGIAVRLARGFGELMNAHSAIVFGWIVMLGSLAAFSQAYCLPRYFSLLMPFLYVTVGTLLFAAPRFRPLATGAVASLCVLNVVNAQGALLPRFDTNGRTGAVLERSREYLGEHRSNIEAVRLIAREHEGLPVIAGRPYVECLALPRLGYVERPSHGYSVSPIRLPHFDEPDQVLTDLPREVIVVSTVNAMTPPGMLPTPAPGDEILYDDGQACPLVVFKRTWPRDTPDKELQLAYQAMLWPAHLAVQDAELFYAAGRFEEAATRCREILAAQPTSAAANLVLAAICDRRGDYAEACSLLKRVVRKAPTHVEAHELLAAICWKQGMFEQAATSLQQVVALDPDNSEAARRLGEVMLGQGRAAEAIECFDRCLQHCADDAVAHLRLAQAYEATNETRLAVDQYRRALDLRSDCAAAANNLAWLLATQSHLSSNDNQEALRWAQHACELTRFKDPITLDTLAVAQAASGKFQRAAATASMAVALAQQSGATNLAERISHRRAAYRASERLHESSP